MVDARRVIGISPAVVVFVNYLLLAADSTVVLRFVAPVMDGRTVLIRSTVSEIARLAGALRIVTDCERPIAQSSDGLSQNG